MAEDNEFKTLNNYYSYKYSKKHGKRAKRATKIATFALALLISGNGIYSAVNAYKADENLVDLAAQIYVLEREIRDLEIDSPLYEDKSLRLEILKDQKENYEKMKTLDIINSAASFGAAALLLSLRKYLEKLIAGESDKRKKKFYEDFLDEIVFINDDKSYDSLNVVISSVLKDAAREKNTSVDALLAEINKDEVFPEFETPYDNILAFIDEFVKTHNYKKMNPVVYNALPLDYIQFAAFLKKKNINIALFRRVPYDKAVDLMEEFLDEIFEEDEQSKVAGETPEPAK